MPKFIGNIIFGAKKIQDNARVPEWCIALSFSQAKLLPPECIICSLNTSDRGSKGSYAKRWYNWFANVEDIINCKNSSKLMLERAQNVLIKNII
jgi:hypothetical protein